MHREPEKSLQDGPQDGLSWVSSMLPEASSDSVLPLAEVKQALALSEGGRTRGKTVLHTAA